MATALPTEEKQGSEKLEGESTYDFLKRLDPSGGKLRYHVLYLESKLEARERSGTDLNVQTLLLAAQFYGGGGNDGGRRARLAAAAVLRRPGDIEQDNIDTRAAHKLREDGIEFEEALRIVVAQRTAPDEDEWADAFEGIE